MPKCPICETKVDNYIETYISKLNNQEYKLYHCPHCDLQWWEPLKMIPRLYEDGFAGVYEIFHLGVRKLPTQYKPFFSQFPLKKGMKLLEIGCADGIFLEEVKRFGIEVWGVDLDKKSVKAAREKRKIDHIYCMSFEDFYMFAKDQGIKFDVITFFEVLEHQDDPKGFLHKIKELLKPGGYIAGSVPNRDSIFIVKSRSYYTSDFPPHHFLRFSYKALYNTLKYAGFDKIEINYTNFNFDSVFPYVEKEVLGNIDGLKSKLKKLAFNKLESSKKSLYAENLTLQYISTIENSNKIIITGLKVLDIFRKIILLPFAIKYLKYLKNNGLFLYFQAKI